VAGSYAYVTDHYAGLRVIDISTPSNPTEVGYHDTPFSARGVAITGSYAYVADRLAGLQIYANLLIGVEEDTELGVQNAGLFQNSPNPFTKETVIRYSLNDYAINDLRLTIYDSAGRVVRTFDLTNYQSPFNQITWDGTNDNGEKVAAGIYFYRLNTGGGKATRKLTILR
jgi:hypothetical protein